MPSGSENCYIKNSSGDEIANVNFLRQHLTCRGQRLCPLHDFLISTKDLHYLPTHPSNRVLTWTRPSNPLRSTMDAPIATRNSSRDMGIGNYSLKSRLLPPLCFAQILAE